MLDVLIKLTGDRNVQGRQVAEYLTSGAGKIYPAVQVSK